MQYIKKETKARALFVLKKMQNKRKRRKQKRKHQRKMFPNGKQTCSKPQKPERAPLWQNTATTGQPWQPSKLLKVANRAKKNFGFSFKKKIDQSKF